MPDVQPKFVHENSIIFHCAIPTNSLGIAFSVVLCVSVEIVWCSNPPFAVNTTIIVNNTKFVRTRYYVFAQDEEHGRTPLSLGVLLNDLSLGKKRNCEKKKYWYLHKVVFL